MTLPCFFTTENYGHLRIFMFLWNCFKQRVDFYVTLMAENCLKNVSKSPLHKFYEIEKTLLWKLQILILFPYKCYKSQCNGCFLMVTWYKKSFLRRYQFHKPYAYCSWNNISSKNWNKNRKTTKTEWKKFCLPYFFLTECESCVFIK